MVAELRERWLGASADDRTNASPRWLVLITVALIAARSIIFQYEQMHLTQPVQRIRWYTHEAASRAIFKNRKPALLFFSHGNTCQECKNMESDLQETAVAEEINRDYVPLKVIDPSPDGLPAPKDVENLKQNYNAWRIPRMVVVPPEMWDVPAEWLDSYQLPDVSPGGMFTPNSDSDRIPLIVKSSADWHPDPLKVGNVDWIAPEKALQRASDAKPALLFFARSLDRHCDVVRSEIFGDDEIAAVIKKQFLPAFVVSHQRQNRPDSDETKRMLARFNIRMFPCLIVTSPSNPDQVLTGFAGNKETLQFLEQAHN